ncbi:MAG: hypothetical protein PHD95_00545 [Candidatus ainarchaeum sp.]|nr:hypothetical protein [Candidatus ainarchaeum sp.]
MTFNNKNSKFAIIFFLILVFSVANAETLFEISPKDRQGELLALYPEETAFLELGVLNSGTQAENVPMKIRCDDAIAFIENGSIQQGIARNIFLQPGEKKTLALQVITLKESDSIQAITISTDKNSFKLGAVKILSPKILLETAAPITKRNFGSFIAKATNLSDETIRNVKLEIFSMQGADSDAVPFLLDSMMPKEHFEKEFAFYLDPPFETKTIVLQASFSDANGFHALQRQIKFNPLYNEENIVLVLASILLIALVAIAIKTFSKKKEEETGEKNL